MDPRKKIIQALNSEELKNLFTIFMNKNLKQLKMVNLATNEISHIFQKAAYISELKKKGKKTVRKIPRDEKWFDSDFKTLKKLLRQL